MGFRRRVGRVLMFANHSFFTGIVHFALEFFHFYFMRTRSEKEGVA